MFVASTEDLVSHLEGESTTTPKLNLVGRGDFFQGFIDIFLPMLLVFTSITIVLLLITYVFDILYLFGFPVSKNLRSHRAERIKHGDLEPWGSGLGAYIVSSAPSMLTVTFLGGLGLITPVLVSGSDSAGYQVMDSLYSPILNGIALVVTAFVVAGSAFLLPNKVAPVKSIVSKSK